MNKHTNLAELIPLIEEQLQSGGSASFTINGISMRPMLEGGVDWVKIVNADFPLKKYDIPFYKRTDGSFVLHRIIKVKKDGYICRGDHQIVKEYYITDSNIIGILSEYSHKGTQKQVDQLGQMVYAIIFVHTAYLRYFIRTILGRIKRI